MYLHISSRNFVYHEHVFEVRVKFIVGHYCFVPHHGYLYTTKLILFNSVLAWVCISVELLIDQLRSIKGQVQIKWQVLCSKFSNVFWSSSWCSGYGLGIWIVTADARVFQSCCLTYWLRFSIFPSLPRQIPAKGSHPFDISCLCVS